jgi:hypothetical protein
MICVVLLLLYDFNDDDDDDGKDEHDVEFIRSSLDYVRRFTRVR